MNDETIKKAFENIVPGEELVEKVLSFESQTAAVSAKRRLRRKYLGAAAAVCAAVVCCVGGSAATGIIDFNNVFGDWIRVDNSELADTLAGSAKNFKYRVSDEAYQIKPKGVTGTDKSIIAIAEISRVDGEPVVDHFANPTDEKHLDNLWYDKDILHDFGGSGGGWCCYVNDEGNIEIYNDFDNEYSINGKTVSVKGENFYPQRAYWDFRTENKTGYFRWQDFAGYVDATDGHYGSDNYVPVDIDDSGVMALDLVWEFSFKYEVSENALKTVSNTSSEGFPYYQDVYKLEEKDGSYTSDESSLIVAENMVQNVHIEIGAIGGTLEFEYPMNEYETAYNADPLAYSIVKSKHNDFYLIMKDGSTMPVWIGGGSGSNEDGLYKCSMNVYYGSSMGMREGVDVDNVVSISLGGVVYELVASD